MPYTGGPPGPGPPTSRSGAHAVACIRRSSTELRRGLGIAHLVLVGHRAPVGAPKIIRFGHGLRKPRPKRSFPSLATGVLLATDQCGEFNYREIPRDHMFGPLTLRWLPVRLCKVGGREDPRKGVFK
jgi:hypothetical protein